MKKYDSEIQSLNEEINSNPDESIQTEDDRILT